jgi:phage shock protein A
VERVSPDPDAPVQDQLDQLERELADHHAELHRVRERIETTERRIAELRARP